MSRPQRAAAPPPDAGMLALSAIEELDDERWRVLFRRRAVYVIGGAILFAAVYALLSWLKYRAYMDARFDLGNMVQAVYNTAHGHFLEITTGDLEPRQMSRLGSHVDPILALFALPWLVWPSPVMLLVAQAAIVATGAWPAYRLGTRVTRDPGAGAFLAGAYLLYPALGFLVLNEFHPVALATPFLLWAFLYMDEDRWVRAAVFLVLAAACKETVPLVIAFMGAYFAIRKRSLWPLVVTAAGVAWFVAAVWVVIPHYNGDQSAFIARYGEYGSGAAEVARNAVLHPGQTAADFLSESNLRYWLGLLWPLGFTSLLSPLTLLIALPEYALNALSTTIYQRRIEFHYTALEIPFLYAAAVLGVMRLWRWLGGGFRKAEKPMKGQRVQRGTLALLVLLCALAGADCVTMAGALLDFALAASYEQLLIEEEIIGYVQRIVKREAIDRETLAEEQIMALPFGGHYLESPHTLAHFREALYFPRLADRRSWDQWYSEGAKDAPRRARERARQILEEAKPAEGLPGERRRAVDAFCASVCSRHNVDPEAVLD